MKIINMWNDHNCTLTYFSQQGDCTPNTYRQATHVKYFERGAD